MQLEHYTIAAGDKTATFKFISEAPGGNIEKIVQFTIIAKDNHYTIYNLAF